jgi:hypothetical protein
MAQITVTGYNLREALKYWGLRRDAAFQAFPGSLHKFAGEEKKRPEDIVRDLIQAEHKVFRLQVAQMQYNLQVMVNFQGSEITLAEAIKRITLAGKVAKMWTTASTPPRHSYLSDRLVRDANQERAQPVLSPEELLELSTLTSQHCEALRTAIAVGNAKEVTLDLDPGLLQ